MPKVGDVIGRFTLQQELGRGPLSEVFLAVEGETRWKVAFKFFVLEPGGKAEERALWAARMLREARAAAAFRQDNVVQVHEIAELPSGPYLVRDFIEGLSLAAYIGDRSQLIFERKVKWLREIALTLAQIHAAGLVHRDVKPTNVLVRRDGALRLLDFGVARRSVDRAAGIVVPTTDRLPGSEHVRVHGTAAYMAPERLGNQGGGAAADQFGWGVVAYEMLAGRLPWGESGHAGPVEIISAILTQVPPSVRLYAPKLPPALDAVLGRAMAKSPAARFPTMDALLRAFDAALR